MHRDGVRLERLTNGDAYFTLSQVALNDVIMIFAFAPIVALLLGISSITVPWDTLRHFGSVYIVIPVILAQIIRKALLARARRHLMPRWENPALVVGALLLTWSCYLRSGQCILAQPLIIALLACRS